MKNKFKILFLAAFLFNIVLTGFAQTASENSDNKNRIYLLEAAFYPDKPDLVAKLYAKATLKRNGAIQYMVLSPELRQKFHTTLEKARWVTGSSTIQIVSYGVVDIKQTANVRKYAIHFNLQTREGKPYFCINHIEIARIKHPALSDSPLWAITKLEFLNPTVNCRLDEVGTK